MGYSELQVKQPVTQALKWVGMDGYEQRYPHHLSVGEKKRTAVATVLSLNPELLVLDEPSSNLDPRSKWSLIEIVKRLPMTKIIASHDLELIEALCQRAIILDGGIIVADGSTTNIFNDVTLLRAHGLAPEEKLLKLQADIQGSG